MIPIGIFFLEDPFSSESQMVPVLFCQPELKASPVILIRSSPVDFKSTDSELCASTALLVNVQKRQHFPIS
jgi:hypothetical protein